ncbi:uncharacterized protein N7515_006059 [Penicillium bovifimosum]|uniref:Uncharacterized protein n=1 Tax=Penicillium bovifimosum TaxID=126998 RepID=A0A9W9GTW7_9EURO|nr:uncharacterized protein N7515_006059 [Penicillium bovifimosum]KAJ5130020.1 hypothetical protein N7515_006059 [Penicillium bovifimosum]
MSNPTPFHQWPILTDASTADRNPGLCPWESSEGIIYEVADSDALWLTVELDASLNDLEDESLLRFVLTHIKMANAVVGPRAQHCIRPRCLSIPCRISDSYAESQAEASRLVLLWIGQVRAGKAWLDRDVLFGPR